MSSLKVISLFSGVGGLDYGFTKLGCELLFANDFNRFACETYRHNFKHFFNDDSPYLVQGDINKNIDKIPTGADLMLAGAPCQSWSMAGKRRGFDDPRGNLLLKSIEILNEKRPRFFIWENVAGLLSHDDGHSFDQVCQLISNSGYSLTFSLLDFSEYGAHQGRKRVILWGSEASETVSPEALMPHKTTFKAKALGTLLKEYESQLKLAPNHNITQGPKNYQQFAPILRPGENIVKLPLSEIQRRFVARGLTPPKSAPKGHRPVYRLSPYSVAPTMVFNGGTNVPWHPWEDRCISVREAALVQGFPIDFEFKGVLREQYKQIANAVPPGISEVLAQAFIKAVL